MLTRIISAAVLAVIAAAVLIIQMYVPVVFTLAMAFLAVAAAYELFGAFSLKEEKLLLYAAVVSAVLMIFTVHTDYFILSIVFSLLILFVLTLYYHGRQTSSKIISYYAVSIFVSASFASAELLISHEDRISGIILFVLGLVSSWFADIGGYFGGRFFGKNKLCPKISPKKTVEGVIGGFVFSLICFMLTGLIVTNLFNKEISYVSLCVLSLIGTPVSIIGDLTFSVIKRESGIKDYGKIIPGHGGILDRFDGVVFTLPLVYVIDRFLPIL